jgi:DNA polymerase-1
MKVIAVDGNSMIFRAYFAFAKSGLSNRQGEETGAIHGFVNMLTSVIDKFVPDQVVVAFDLPEDTFRHKLIDDYKGGRPDTPESLISQLLYIKEFLILMDIPIYEISGFEADDILATVSSKVTERGGETILVSGDRDIFQLIKDPNIKLLYPVKGITQTSLFDEQAVFEKTGVYPKDYPLYATLRGDPSDNLPGVKKVGEKTAATIVSQYKTLDEIYENLHRLKPAVAESFTEAKTRIYNIYELVHLKKDLSIELDLDGNFKKLTNRSKLDQFFGDLEIVQSWSRLKQVLIKHFSTALPEEHFVVEEVSKSDGIRTPDENNFSDKTDLSNDNEVSLAPKTDVIADELKIEIKSKNVSDGQKNTQGYEVSATFRDSATLPNVSYPLLAFDFVKEDEFIDLLEQVQEQNRVIGVVSKYLAEPGRSKFDSVALVDLSSFQMGSLDLPDINLSFKSCIIDFDSMNDGQVVELVSVLQTCKIVGYSVKEVIRSINLYTSFEGETEFDVAIAAYLVDPELSKLSLEDLAEYLISGQSPKSLLAKRSDSTNYNTLDLKNTNSDAGNGYNSGFDIVQFVTSMFKNLIVVYQILTQKLIALEEFELMKNIEMPVSDCLCRMEILGIGVDSHRLKTIILELEDMSKTLSKSIYEAVGHEFNIGSPKQLSTVLYDEIGLLSSKKTKTGRSTSAATLEKLRGIHPVVDLTLQFREVEKLRTTYGASLLKTVESDNRIHASFSLIAARTGRITSENPNLHNIPVRTDLGQRFRQVFVANENCKFILADYDQIELRILAYYSKDENMLTAFSEQQDIHSFVASVVFGIDVENVDKNMRNISKMVSYGLVYGMEAYGLSERLNISISEAKDILDKYFASFPKLKEFIESSIQEVKDCGYTTTILGRKRYFGDLKKLDHMQRHAVERQATNSIIQGSAADLFKLAIIRVREAIRRNNLKAELVLQVHDELIIESDLSCIDEVSDLVLQQMEGVSDIGIPLKIHLSCGKSWADK